MDKLYEPVSVVIVNYNAGKTLVDSVRSALDQAAQVIVVDNCSTDASISLLFSEFANEPRLFIRWTLKNNGFAAGCNAGLGFVDQKMVLFLNPDCLLMPKSLRRMTEAINAVSEVGMVGGFLCNFDGSEQPGGRRAVPTPWRSFVRAFSLNKFQRRWPKLFRDYCLHNDPLPAEPVDVEAISGALMLVKMSAMQDVGFWDDAYFLHCEDLDLCMRFRQKGWRILFVPSAQVMHHHGYCSQGRPFFVEWHKHRGMMRFYHKFFKHQYPGFLMVLVTLGVWLRFFLVSVRNLKSLAFLKMQERDG